MILCTAALEAQLLFCFFLPLSYILLLNWPIMSFRPVSVSGDIPPTRGFDPGMLRLQRNRSGGAVDCRNDPSCCFPECFLTSTKYWPHSKEDLSVFSRGRPAWTGNIPSVRDRCTRLFYFLIRRRPDSDLMLPRIPSILLMLSQFISEPRGRRKNSELGHWNHVA